MAGPLDTPLDTIVEIETPEHIVFHHRVAGPARRLMAHLIDLCLCYAVLIMLGGVLLVALLGASAATRSLESAIKTALGLFLLALFAAQWLYFFLFEAITGRTPGKRALGLRVVTVSGRPIGLRAAALRNLVRAADALPAAYLFGVASMLFSARFQRLGDLVAGTIVVVPERTRIAKPIVLSPSATAQELERLPDRVALDADERAAIELFLRRRDTLGSARERELAEMIAGPLAERFGYRVQDPSRTLALLYDRAVNAGRTEAPPSSREGAFA